MRSLILIGLVGAAACGDNTGLVLTISAPDGPSSASRIELVLASTDAIETVKGQLTGGDVRYYRQKSTAGAIEDLSQLDGFVVRIEGRSGKGDEPFVPFVIAYDGSRPIAAGSVLDPQGLPLALEVPTGSRIEATATLTPLSPADLTKGILSGQIAELSCERTGSNTPWRSGIAWQAPAGVQLRLLFPDPSSGSALDASARRLDLDCDDHPADDGDCDDVRARFHPDAAEACDGEDTNCDRANFSISRCAPPEAECGAGSTDGVQLCQDVNGGTTIGMCVAAPACRCRTGSPLPCARCTLGFEGTASPVEPCAPAAAKLQLPILCEPLKPCTVAVVQADGPWEVGVAADPRGDFERITGVTSSEVWLRVKPEQSSVSGAPGSSVGAVHLVITNGATPPLYIGIDLELGPGAIADCSNIPMVGGYFGMACNLL